MLKNRPDLQLLPPIATGDESQVAHREARALLASANIPAAIYCIGAGRQGVAEALADINPSDRPMVVMHDLTEGTGKWLSTGLISAVIDQNAKLVGEQAVVRLLGSIVSTAPFLPPQPIEPRIILRSNLPTRPGGDG
jgi:LacI family transcriptional regulator